VSPRSRLALLVSLLLAIGVAAPVSAAGPTAGARQAADAAAYEDRLIVVWKTAPPDTLRMDGVAGTESTSRPLRTVVTAEPGDAADVAATLRQDPRVLLVVPDAELSYLDWPADADPSDPLFADQADLAQIEVPEAWKSTVGDPSVVVAVIDSGFDLTHPTSMAC
jgi:subtilisin family serine protease